MAVSKWLSDAIFYEIYPQSFCDSNGDGIGDLKGILSKLDYIQNLGCNAVWLNPCFDSPFVDAGYDVRDYFRIAPRYGTNEDLKTLAAELHRRGMHLLLDLVPGHTSDECRWFQESQRAAKNEYTDRYVWTDSVWDSFEGVGQIMGVIRGGTERNGACAANFFNAQPALNYGFAQPDPTKPWQQAVDAPGPMATRAAIRDVMRFWLGLGVDGFRVDMAGSLVKSDPEQRETIRLWQDFRAFLDREYPEAVLVSEWGQPDRSLLAGFHMDFLLHFGPSHYLDLFRVEHPYFSREGKGDCRTFFDIYLHNRELTGGKGLICIPSGNHDMIRLSPKLDDEELKIVFAFLYSMPGVPFLYYGDEIGERYVEGLASVEGGYERTGSRSPMAWDRTTNAGFSSAPKEDLYIAQGPSVDRVNVETEAADPDSVLNAVKEVIRVRKDHPALKNDGDFALRELSDHSYPLVYERSAEGERVLVVLNPSGSEAPMETALPEDAVCFYAQGGMRGQSGYRRDASGRCLVPAGSAAFFALS